MLEATFVAARAAAFRKEVATEPEALGNRCGQEKHQGNLLCFKVLSFSDDFVENPEAHIIIRHSFKYPFHGC